MNLSAIRYRSFPDSDKDVTRATLSVKTMAHGWTRIVRMSHAAYAMGFGDGWGYGEFIHTELDYRLGYREGFVEAMTDAAVSSFHTSYATFYDGAYRAAFDEWSVEPKTEIEAVWLSDANADGIFEPFVTGKSGGTGLGLSLTQQIIEAHGGRVRVVARSASLGGASFRIELPKYGG